MSPLTTLLFHELVPTLDRIRAEIDKAHQANHNTSNVCLIPDPRSPRDTSSTPTSVSSHPSGATSDDIHDGESSWGIYPRVSTSCEQFGAQNLSKAKEATMEKALQEVSQLKARNDMLENAMLTTRKNAHEAEDKARKKSEQLTMAKKAIIDRNQRIDMLENENIFLNREMQVLANRNALLNQSLGNAEHEVIMKQEELMMFKTKFDEGLKQAKKCWYLYRELGNDLFEQLTRLEILLANGTGEFFFDEDDLDLKKRADTYLPLSDECKSMQHRLYKLSMDNDEEDTLNRGLSLAIEAAPTDSKAFEIYSDEITVREKGEGIQAMVEVLELTNGEGKLEANVPEYLVSTPNEDLCSEGSLFSQSSQGSSEEDGSNSATTNEYGFHDLEKSVSKSSCADAVAQLSKPGSPTSRPEQGLKWLLGYNSAPEEPFYPQYAQEHSKDEETAAESGSRAENDSKVERISEPEAVGFCTGGPDRGLSGLVGYNPSPSEQFYPQYTRSQSTEDQASYDISKERFEPPGLQSSLNLNADQEEPTQLQYFQQKLNDESTEPATSVRPRGESSSELPVEDSHTEHAQIAILQDGHQINDAGQASSTAIGTADKKSYLAWLLGYNPQPEEEFYPQYSLQNSHKKGLDSGISEAHYGMDNPVSKAEEVPEESVVASEAGLSWLLGYNPHPEEAFYPQYAEPTSQEGDAKSRTSAENGETTIPKRPELVTVVDVPVESPTESTNPEMLENPSVYVSFADTAKDFKAGKKTRAERRQAAIKAQADAVAEMKRIAEEKHKARMDYGDNMSRQERRAAERKARKDALKRSR